MRANRPRTKISSLLTLFVEPTKSGKLRVRWGHAIICATFFSLLAWLCAATGVFFFVKYQAGFRDVRFRDISLIPFRLEQYRKSKGTYWINSGLQEVSKNNWRDGMDQLRAGLQLVPDHYEARMTVAKIYLLADRSDQAQETLIEGIKHHPDSMQMMQY